MNTKNIAIGIFLLISCSAFSQVSTVGLVAYYPFNGNTNDESITANHATVYGSTLTTDRNNISGKAYSFNGSSDRLQAAKNDVYDFGNGDFSITSWVSLNTITTSRIVSAGYDSDDGIWGLGLGSHPKWGTGLRINYFVYSGGDYRDFSSNEITGYSLGNWAFVGVTKTGNTLTFYFNGQQAGTATIPFVSNANSYLSIGSRQLTSGSQIEFLNGKIDEVRIYKRSLNESEIFEGYNSSRNSLIAYYPFNGNANDESGNGINPNYIGVGVTLTTDRFGKSDNSYSFDGNTDSHIKIPADRMPTTNRTISLWFNVPDVTNRPGLLGYGGNGECGTTLFMGLNCLGSGQFFVQGHCGNNQAGYTYATAPVNKWYHYVLTINDSTQKIYVNGVLKSTENTFSGSTVVAGKDLAFGVITSINGIAPYTDVNVGYLKGKLDDVRIYDAALSEEQVQELYQTESSGLIAYYPFNGNANDESGNGNHGTITGALVTPAVNRYGEEGKAYKFWNPDYISVPTNSSFFTDEFTVSYWYKVASYWGERGVLSCVGNKGGYQQFFTGTTFSSITGYNFISGNSWFYSNYTVPNETNIWHHAVITYQKTGVNQSITKLYLNGELKKSENHDLTIGFPGSDIFYIGTNHGDLNFNGELDDIRFYNRTLSDAEIMSLHTSELPNAVNNQFISNISISPNPTDGHFVIDLGSTYQNIKINICDITGRTIKEMKYSNVQRLNQKIEAPSGIYFINIISENEKATYKLIKK